MSKFGLVTTITVELAGRTPPVGSKICPHPPAASISAFNCATLLAVAAFWTNPNQVWAGQLILKVLVFNGAPPILIRNISLYASSVVLSHASTKILSISKHCEKLWFENKNKLIDKVKTLKKFMLQKASFEKRVQSYKNN